MNHADHGQSVLRLFILHTVSSDEEDARLTHLIEPTLENLPEYGHVHGLCGKADNIHGRERPSPMA